MPDVCIRPAPTGSTLRVESCGARTHIIFPEYSEPHYLVRWLQVLFSPLILGPFALLIPINYVLQYLGLSAAPTPRVRRHFEVEVSAERLTFLHWYGEEVWNATDIHDVFIDEAGGDGSEYDAVFCSVSGCPARASDRVTGYHDFYAQNGRRQITYSNLPDCDLVWVKDTISAALGLPMALRTDSAAVVAR